MSLKGEAEVDHPPSAAGIEIKEQGLSTLAGLRAFLHGTENAESVALGTMPGTMRSWRSWSRGWLSAAVFGRADAC